MDFLYFQTCLTDALCHVFRIVHLAVAIGNSRKVQAGHCKRKSGCGGFLPILQCFHDENPGLLCHG